MTAPDPIRAALQRLTIMASDELTTTRQWAYTRQRWDDALAAARAALAAASPDGPAVPEDREPASVTGQPSDRELLELMPETMRDEFAYAATTCSDATGGQVKPGIFRVCLNTAALEYARAVLARWGTPNQAEIRSSLGAAPAPPDEGEVGELVAELRSTADGLESQAYPQTAALITRAADLLEQRHPAPVPVSERLPGPEDCDAEGRCWWWYPPVPEQTYGYWIYEDNAVPERSRLEWPDSWLPAHALPLPGGEVEA